MSQWRFVETKYFNWISYAKRLYFLSFHNLALYLQTMRGTRENINLRRISGEQRSCERYCRIARSDFNTKICQHLHTEGKAVTKTVRPNCGLYNASLCVPQKSGVISSVILRDVNKRHSTVFVWKRAFLLGENYNLWART